MITAIKSVGSKLSGAITLIVPRLLLLVVLHYAGVVLHCWN